MGDLADLADLAAIAGGRGADFVLLNPLHAGDIVPPLEPSPYLPTSRRFLSPLYARPEQIREFAYLDATARERVLTTRTTRRPAGSAVADGSAGAAFGEARIDRDAVWASKREALEVIFTAGRGAARQAEFDAFVAEQGEPLREICCDNCCGTPGRCASITSSGCSGCGAYPPASRPRRERTSPTIMRRCSAC